MSFPNIFQWLPAGPFVPWDAAGFILAFSAVGMLSLVVLISRRKMTNEVMLKIALIFVVLVPFLLPEMHERYYYIADVISLVYAFYFPKYFYIPIFMQISSFDSYSTCLQGHLCISSNAVISLKYIAFLVLMVIIITTLDLAKTLFPASEKI
jgi:Gpi18-like mannosyltransferase